MATFDPRKMRKSLFAKLAGVSLTTVANWIRQGAPVNPDGTLDPWAVAEWKFGREKHVCDPEVNDESASASRARLIKAQADAQEMENAERRGELLDATDVSRTWEGAVSRCRSRLLSLPGKAAPQVVGCSSLPEVKDLLEQFVHEALEELAADGGDVDTGDGEEVEGGGEPVPATAETEALRMG